MADFFVMAGAARPNSFIHYVTATQSHPWFDLSSKPSDKTGDESGRQLIDKRYQSCNKWQRRQETRWHLFGPLTGLFFYETHIVKVYSFIRLDAYDKQGANVILRFGHRQQYSFIMTGNPG